MPSQALPLDSTWIVAIADATTAGWRVAGLEVPVDRVMRSVVGAASAKAANVSPPRFCESVKASPSQPWRSAICANSTARPAIGNVPSQNSTTTSLAPHLVAMSSPKRGVTTRRDTQADQFADVLHRVEAGNHVDEPVARGGADDRLHQVLELLLELRIGDRILR